MVTLHIRGHEQMCKAKATTWLVSSRLLWQSKSFNHLVVAMPHGKFPPPLPCLIFPVCLCTALGLRNETLEEMQEIGEGRTSLKFPLFFRPSPDAKKTDSIQRSGVLVGLGRSKKCGNRNRLGIHSESILLSKEIDSVSSIPL